LQLTVKISLEFDFSSSLLS